MERLGFKKSDILILDPVSTLICTVLNFWFLTILMTALLTFLSL